MSQDQRHEFQGRVFIPFATIQEREAFLDQIRIDWREKWYSPREKLNGRFERGEWPFDDVIQSPGKFEGESIVVVYLWEHDAPPADEHGWAIYTLDDEVRREFEINPGYKAIAIRERDDGSIESEWLTGVELVAWGLD